MTKEEKFKQTVNMFAELEQHNFKSIDVKTEIEALLGWSSESYLNEMNVWVIKELRKRKIQKLNELES